MLKLTEYNIVARPSNFKNFVPFLNTDFLTSPQVISSMRVMMTEDLNTADSSSFLLEDSAR